MSKFQTFDPGFLMPKLKEKLIVALDVETAEKAREIIAELREEVGAFKIGLQLFTSAGASFVRELAAGGVKLFLDLKFHDIPNTAAKASIEAARLGIWMFNVHALGGAEMMRKTLESVREVCDRENLRQPKIIGVTILTSFDQQTLKEVGIENEINEQVIKLARLTAKAGLEGVVASPAETKAIRENIEKKDFLIVTPGIRSSESAAQSPRFETFDDQKRVMTAREAVKAGADFLVVGRPILQAKEKVETVRRILREIKRVSA